MLQEIEITIEGTTPLILNRFSDAAAEQTEGGGGAIKIGRQGTPQEIAEAKLYLDHDGQPCIPQPNLFRCIIDGGTFFKAGKSKVTTQKTSLLCGCVEIGPLTIPIEHSQPWKVDTRPVRIPSTGGRILAHRPSFDDWKLSFECVVDTSMLPVKLLREIVDAAGRRIGLGDFRPACKGPYGKFTVTRWEMATKAHAKAG